MFFKFKINKCQQYLTELPKISQSADNIKFLYNPNSFREKLIEEILNATKRIYIVTLYLEQDESGQIILNSLYEAKRKQPNLNIIVLVDWHRAHRGRIGTLTSSTNADWYYRVALENQEIDIPVLGVPVSIHEAFGVLHFKGFIIDDSVFYSGISINNTYFHKVNKCSYDRYHLIRSAKIADVMFNWINYYLVHGRGVQRINNGKIIKVKKIKNEIRLLRQELKKSFYNFQGDASNEQFSVTPLVGLGKSSLLNKTIFHLTLCAKEKLIICTPYFNLPTILVKNIVNLLRKGKKVEIIVGDKTASDFFIPEDKPFKIIGMLPYMYEVNLRRFLIQLQYFINKSQLILRLWKKADNNYHIKGIWVDKEWILITGNNLNIRGWRLDLENAILMHDPHHQLNPHIEQELNLIRTHTTIIHNYHELQNTSDYPVKVRRLIQHLRHVRIDRLINNIL